MGQSAQKLRLFVESLGSNFGVERSFKLSAKTLYTDRFLLSVHKDALGGDADILLSKLSQSLHMPILFLNRLIETLPECDIVHFGFEASNTEVCKIYLEFSSSLNFRDSSEHLLFLAFKWSPNCVGSQTVSRYSGCLGLSQSAIESRMAGIFSAQSDEQYLTLLESILAKACLVSEARNLFFLTVSDEEGQRSSFDLNLYNAKMRLNEIKDEVVAFAQLMQVSRVEVESLLMRSGMDVLGHVSAGFALNGKIFISFYFGVVEGRNMAAANAVSLLEN